MYNLFTKYSWNGMFDKVGNNTLDKVKLAKSEMILAHKGQFRKDGTTPYSVHPEKVVSILKKLNVKDSDVLCAGYLHDVLEDTPYGEEKIKEKFGDIVLSLVKELTFKNKISSEEYLESCHKMSANAKLVKVSDVLANLGDKGDKSEHFIQKRVNALVVLLNGLNLN